MRLIEEIERFVPILGDIDEKSLRLIGSPEIRSLIRRKNGTLALSGALVLFGCSVDHAAPLDISRYRDWHGRTDYALEHTDDIFAADIFGDLLFVRSATVFRLDGETGRHVKLDDVSTFLDRQLGEIAQGLGGALGRQHFANRGIGIDPLRLLPTVPFMMQQHTKGAFFEVPLSRAIALKHRLFLTCRAVPDSLGVDCGFWLAAAQAANAPKN